LLHFVCSATKLFLSGTTPSSPNCRVVLAQPLSPGKRANTLCSCVPLADSRFRYNDLH
jgi:hypothetical protein